MNENLRNFINETQTLLPVGKSISLPEAEKRAGQFLYALAYITDERFNLGDAKIKALSVQSAVYAEVLAAGEAKTITENKIAAEANPAYIGAREELEIVENQLTFLKAYYEIFNNAHIFYRNMAKGEFGV